MLNLLYRHGATQNIGDYAQSGNIAMVAELLGEHPEKVLDALGNAAYMKQPDIVEMVLNQYKPELTEGPWFQALYDAMRESIADRHGVSVMEAIFECGISPNVRGRENHTLLQRTKIELMRIADEERVSLARCLLERGADIDAKDDELQSTALGWAACYGRKELVTFLLECGAAVNLPDDEPWATPLARAENSGAHGHCRSPAQPRGDGVKI